MKIHATFSIKLFFYRFSLNALSLAWYWRNELCCHWNRFTFFLSFFSNFFWWNNIFKTSKILYSTNSHSKRRFQTFILIFFDDFFRLFMSIGSSYIGKDSKRICTVCWKYFFSSFWLFSLNAQNEVKSKVWLHFLNITG